MHKDAPSTPAEVLEISHALRLVMHAVCLSADLLKYWNYPFKKAATSFEEMSLLDKLYWAYKCKKPVTRAEKGTNIEGYFRDNPGSVELPEGFKKTGNITFGAVGDLIQAQGLENSKDILYEKVAGLLFDRTISFANLESPLTNQEPKKEVISDKESPIECCSKEQFDILKGHKGKCFTVMHTAGNHMLDMGREGVETTLKQFDADGIVDVGTNRNKSSQGKGKILVKNGIKIGFVSATYGLNGQEIPAGAEHLINVARLLPKNGEPDLTSLKDQITHCREENCDFIIASLHWGYEFEFFPRKRQIDIAHTIVEWGADAVVGHHPHVIQPVEYYRTHRDPRRIAVIAYSLGSLTWSFSAPHLVLSEILNLSIAKGGFQGEERTYIESATVTPVFRNQTRAGNSSITRIEILDDYLNANEDRDRMNYLSEIRKYADLVLGVRTIQAKAG